MLSLREISSRSERLSACLARCLSAGRIPPVGDITEKIDEDSRSNRRPIELIGLPAIPDLGSLGRRVVNATSLFHVHTPSLLKD
jgi:hypothetical protein